MKPLFDLELVDTYISGIYIDVKNEISGPSIKIEPDFINRDIFEKYNILNWEGVESTSYQPDDDYFSQTNYEEMLNSLLEDDLLNHL